MWSARDALVLKAMALVLTARLTPHLSRHCYHLPGHGGAKAAVQEVMSHLRDNPFVFRTDVQSYYAGTKVGQAFQPDGVSQSGWKA